MKQQLSLHLRKFNDRIKVMNQTNARDLVLSAVDARNLQAEIFELLTQIQELTVIKQESNEPVDVEMNGGNF
jgi:hypothetical protein